MSETSHDIIRDALVVAEYALSYDEADAIIAADDQTDSQTEALLAALAERGIYSRGDLDIYFGRIAEEVAEWRRLARHARRRGAKGIDKASEEGYAVGLERAIFGLSDVMS